MPDRSRSDEGWNYAVNRYNPTRQPVPPPVVPFSPFTSWLARTLAAPMPPGYGQTWYGPSAAYPGLFGGVGATGMASYPNVMGTPYGGVNPYLSGQSAYPYRTPTYAPEASPLSPEWVNLWKSRLTYEPTLRADLVAANAPPADNNYYRDALLRMANAYNKWGDYIGGGIDYRLSPLNISNIKAIPAGGDFASGFKQLNRWGQPVGTKGSPAPVIGRFQVGTRYKKNFNPNKWKPKEETPTPTWSTGVAPAFGYANWRP